MTCNKQPVLENDCLIHPKHIALVWMKFAEFYKP